MQARLIDKCRQIAPAVWIIMLMCLIYGIYAPGFFTLSNLVNVAVQASPLLIVATGITMVILTEGTDLSAGFTMGFVGVVVSLLLKAGWTIGWAIFAGLAAGCLCGFFNGIIVSKLGLPPFIATLGFGNVIYGVGLVLTGGQSIQAMNPILLFLADGEMGGINMSIILALAVFGVSWILMNLTVFGRNVISLGGNPEALRATGVNVRRVQTMVYSVCGLLSAIAGLLVASRMGSGYAAAAMGWDFDAIGATIIGGTSFREGKGGISKTVLGVLLISILRNGLNVAGVPNMYQFALIGLVVIITIILDVQFRQTVERGSKAR